MAVVVPFMAYRWLEIMKLTDEVVLDGSLSEGEKEKALEELRTQESLVWSLMDDELKEFARWMLSEWRWRNALKLDLDLDELVDLIEHAHTQKAELLQRSAQNAHHAQP